MEDSTRNRESDSQECGGPVPGEEELIAGWCKGCSCEIKYHIGDDSGVCVGCGCTTLSPDPDSKLWDRFSKHLLPEFPDEDDAEEWVSEDLEELAISLDTVDSIAIAGGKEDFTYSTLVFFGKISRSCKRCGDVKLFREFRDSRDPETLCRFCEVEVVELQSMDELDEDTRREIEEVEYEIIMNELEFDEAQERQEIIDSVLRELDE